VLDAVVAVILIQHLRRISFKKSSHKRNECVCVSLKSVTCKSRDEEMLTNAQQQIFRYVHQAAASPRAWSDTLVWK